MIIAIMIYVTPVIDRDEARYAQTSFQISESNNFINLKFDETLRLKKPPGIYWIQFASYKIFNNFFDKEIWMFRIPSLLSFMLLLFFTHKLARLLFYDLNTMIPLVALAGTIIVIFESIQATTDMAYAAFSIMSLFFFIKCFKKENNYSHIFFIISSLIAMLIKGPLFLVIIGVTLFFKLSDFSISNKKKIMQLSNLSIVVLSSIFLGILYNILTDGQFFQQSLIKDFSEKIITSQESHGGIFGYYFLGSFLIVFPIYPLFIIGIFYNLFKKINWDRNLLMILTTIFLFILLLEIIPTKLPHYILPVIPLMAIYLSRTLEFIEFKLSKIIIGLNMFLV
ncbi:glycosyltransferase family 39 protein, partial [Alphaproteobacteria bacterium]|nr:glycosyltransferase family 39 protein [Alphaproteobacteria bacterium]